MQYRTVGSTGVEVSALGFGCMRLPVIEGRQDAIDVPRATEMLYRAIDGGVNYVDTAYPYHGTGMATGGQSEPFVGAALANGYRDKVHLATKLPTWLIEKRDDMDRYLDEQLGRLQTDRIDFYLLHALNASMWEKVRDLGALEFLDAAKKDGRIGHAAFSFHGEAETFPKIIDAYDWAFGQIQYNYVDIGYQAGLVGLRYAARKGVSVVVMEPLKGGRLAANLPPAVQAVFDAAPDRHEPADWALRFVWDEPGVATVLSGMSTLEQVEANLAYADHAEANSLTPEQHRLFSEARDALSSGLVADCTACRYCMPCPAGVDIPAVLAQLNAASMWDDPGVARFPYSRIEGKASLCTECGACVTACPQMLPIPDLMAQAADVFGE